MTVKAALSVVRDSGGDAVWPAPVWLGALAAAEWDRLVPLLGLTEANRSGLEAYCECYGLFRQAQVEVEAGGPTAAGGPKGPLRVKNPAIQVMRDANRDLLRWSVELGITPRSKTRHAETASDKRTAQRLLSGG
jgi:P27 family predicted phage terminase small subunit